MRWPALLLVLAACDAPPPPSPQPPAEPAEPAELQPPQPQPVPEASPPPAPPPEPPGVFHLAATVDGFLSLTPIAPGAIVVSSQAALAGAAAGQGTLELDPEAAGFLDKHTSRIGSVGGRWPDAVYIAAMDYGCRTPCDDVVVRDRGSWRRHPVPAPRGLVAYYDRFRNDPDGRVYALRQYRALAINELMMLGPDDEDDDRQSARIARYRPPRAPASRIDTVLGDGPEPRLPAGHTMIGFTPAGERLAWRKDGAIVRLVDGAWRPYIARGADWPKSPRDVSVGDDGRLYTVAPCVDDRSDGLRRWDGATWKHLPFPGGRCLKVVVADDGTAWGVDGGVWRARDDDWEQVPVRVAFADGAEDLHVDTIVTRPGAVWISGYTEHFGRSAALTTLPVAAVVVLPE